MKDRIKAVELFHQTYGLPVLNQPSLIDPERYTMRHSIMAEEVDEYLDACKDENLVEIADALTDQLYILCGTIIEHGMQDLILPCFEEVQRSNMSKLGADGKPIYRSDGKVLKGPNYSPPDLRTVIERYHLGKDNRPVEAGPEPIEWTPCSKARGIQ